MMTGSTHTRPQAETAVHQEREEENRVRGYVPVPDIVRRRNGLLSIDAVRRNQTHHIAATFEWIHRAAERPDRATRNISPVPCPTNDGALAESCRATELHQKIRAHFPARGSFESGNSRLET